MRKVLLALFVVGLLPSTVSGQTDIWTVRASAYTVRVGESITITSTTSVPPNDPYCIWHPVFWPHITLGSSWFSQEQDQNAPILEPARPHSQGVPNDRIAPGDTVTNTWTLEAVRPGTVYVNIRVEAYQAGPDCSNPPLYTSYGYKGTGPITVLDTFTPTHQIHLPLIARLN